MEVEIPESAEISSATNKTAAGILTLPDAPQNQPKTSAALTQSTSAQSRPTTPPNTKHPSPASTGNSPARKQRNTQTGTHVQTRSASRPKRLTLLPMTERIKRTNTKTGRYHWETVCGFCRNKGHDRLSCPGLQPENMNTESSDSRNLDSKTTPMLLYLIETLKPLSSNPIVLDLVSHCNVYICFLSRCL